MAEFTTKCPHCNTELVAEEDWIGMEVECPSCQQSFTVAKEFHPSNQTDYSYGNRKR